MCSSHRPTEPPPEVEDVEIEEPVLVDATLEEPDALDDDAQDEPQGEPEFTPSSTSTASTT